MANFILRLADDRQHVTLTQVLAAGGSRSMWDRARRSGLLVPVHPGVARISTAPAAPWHAALLAVNGGVLSHRSAAAVWGVLDGGTEPVEVTVADRRRDAHLAGVRLHRPADVVDLAVVRRNGLRVTNPLRTVVDVAGVCSPDELATAVEGFLVARTFGLSALEAAVSRHGRKGRPGIGPVRALLATWALGDVPPDSVLEPAMARLLSEHGLPPAAFHHVVRVGGRRFELDFAMIEERIDIEVDGWAHHGGRQSFEADRARDAYLAGGGWHVCRFTWLQVNRQPVWVAERLRAIVALRS
jgi:very-short-patch-repair endonuclease